MQINPMPLDRATSFILNRLTSLGYEANLVGGSVRNHLLGLPVTDVDITTSATPDETKAAFFDCRVIETGIKHGTVTVLVDGTPCEITTYRSDGEYLDNRHPSSVEFTTSLRDDLSRRDFTVNAICYNPQDGYTDLFDGVGDIERRVIRAIGDPEVRFREDALRILRALRFSSVLGFDIDPATADAIHSTRHLLRNVSRERIYVEWDKLLGGSGAYGILTDYPDVIEIAIPELSGLKLPTREAFLAADTTVRALALFFLTTADPVSCFDTAMRALHTDNFTRIGGSTALKIYPTLDPTTPESVALAVYEYGITPVTLAISLGICLGKFSPAVRASLDAVKSGKVISSLSSLAIDGADLVARGIRGRAVGDLLDMIVRMVISGELANERATLIAYVDNTLGASD